TEREQPVTRQRRRGLGSGPMRGSRGIHLEGRAIARPPDDLGCRGVERRHDLVLALSGEDVDAIAGHDWRRIAGAHFYIPTPGEGLGPRGRLTEGRDDAVTVRAAPLRPVLSRYPSGKQHGRNNGPRESVARLDRHGADHRTSCRRPATARSSGFGLAEGGAASPPLLAPTKSDEPA